ncbi:glycosyl transferase [Alphaproteobacteria bacterium]|nr:glycosyl transferase [Alphaproteobacteria bacterium]
MNRKHILVIKLSALGDFVQATGPFKAIRTFHKDAFITLLTTKPYAELANASGYFDRIWIDDRPRIWDVPRVLRLRRLLRSTSFDRVYDLQTSDRTGFYFQAMGRPVWSGVATGCALPHDNPDRNKMHTVERQAEQLRMAGIPDTPPPDVSWLKSDLSRFDLPEKYVILIPGGAPHRPIKRWPAPHFAEIARRARALGVSSVLVGTKADVEPIQEIVKRAPFVRSLVDQTDFADIAELGRGGAGAVSNDTGPAHLIVAAGCPTVVLFSRDSNPDRCAPRGRTAILKKDDLGELSPDEVWDALHSPRLRSS